MNSRIRLSLSPSEILKTSSVSLFVLYIHMFIFLFFIFSFISVDVIIIFPQEHMLHRYNYQPPPTTLLWVLQKWTSPKNNSESSTLVDHRLVEEIRFPKRQPKRKQAIPDDVLDNCSVNAEIYNSGDSPFCYSTIFCQQLKLDKRFLGTLLGYACNGYLSTEVMKIKYILIRVFSFIN